MAARKSTRSARRRRSRAHQRRDEQIVLDLLGKVRKIGPHCTQLARELFMRLGLSRCSALADFCEPLHVRLPERARRTL